MRKETLKHYVEFHFPKGGSDDRVDLIREVESRDRIGDIPSRTMRYDFFDRQEYVAEDGEVLVGTQRNCSGSYYFGEGMTVEEAQRQFPNEGISGNFHMQPSDKVVRIELGGFRKIIQLDKEDAIVEMK